MRLLVVEDDPDLNRQLATALTDAGYVVDRAFDGEEGHFLGESEPYDAVILDIGLPKMDGISVLEAWRRAGRRPWDWLWPSVAFLSSPAGSRWPVRFF